MTGLIGKTLGGYRIVSQIGQGGMATVYKAYQPSLDRYVAVKVLPSYYAEQDDSFTKRFEREARSVAKLRHPNILMVHDYGEHQGINYIIMEYVDSGTYKNFLATKPDFATAVKLIGQVASALDYAHEQGVIHRDIKPSNIMMPKEDWVLLTDFGLATMVGGSMLTQSGMTVGTPAYMSPEQGRGEKVGLESDIYSLGVILYELVTGVVPFTAETPMAVVVKHIIEPLPLPSSKKEDIPEAVERIILKSMAKEPENRFRRAGEMALALNQFLITAESRATHIAPEVDANLNTIPPTPVSDHTIQEPAEPVGMQTIPAPAAPVGAQTQPMPEVQPRSAATTPPKKRRWPMFVALGSLLVVVAVAVTLLLTGFFSEEGDWLSSELEATRTAAQIRADADAAITSGDFETAIVEFESALAADPYNRDLYLDLAKTNIQYGDLEAAEDAIRTALEVSPQDAWLQEMVGQLYLEMGEYEKSIQYYELAIEMGGPPDPALQGIADAYQAMGEPDKAIAILESSLDENGDNNPMGYENLGRQFLEMGEFTKAEEAFRAGLALDPTFTSIWWSLADVYRWQGDIQGAIAVMQEGIAVNPEAADLQDGLGWIYRDAGEYENAIAAFETAIELNPEGSMSYSGLAELHWEMGDPEKGITLLEEAIQKFPYDGFLQETLGRLYQNSGRDQEASPYFEKAIEIDPFNTWAYINLARSYQRTGKHDEVYDLLYETADKNQQDPWMYESIGQIFVEMGDCDTAIEFFEQALEIDPSMDMAAQGIQNCEGN
jgi:serine/threonine protein kinase/tetratricopeptide (TPR) repeat protein